jgi:hypothetical protein
MFAEVTKACPCIGFDRWASDVTSLWRGMQPSISRTFATRQEPLHQERDNFLFAGATGQKRGIQILCRRVHSVSRRRLDHQVKEMYPIFRWGARSPVHQTEAASFTIAVAYRRAPTLKWSHLVKFVKLDVHFGSSRTTTERAATMRTKRGT